MPASDTSTQRTQVLALLERRGMTRLAEFREAGITATTVSRMERSGEIVRLARGLYHPPMPRSMRSSRWPKLPGSCPKVSSAWFQHSRSTASPTGCRRRSGSPLGARTGAPG